jgi:hypothetical protein
MDLAQFISNYNDKIVGGGQCGELVDLYLVEVFGNHTSYATALDYWTSGIPGFSVITSPEAGDIACYNAHPGFPAGHIAIYAGNGEVFEQNADPDGSPAHLFARASTYLLGYLRKDEPMSTWTNGDTYNLLFHAVNEGVANQAQAANYVGFFGAQNGQESEAAFNAIISSPQFDELVAAARTTSTLDKASVVNYIESNLN